jgi:hypothetical protein
VFKYVLATLILIELLLSPIAVAAMVFIVHDALTGRFNWSPSQRHARRFVHSPTRPI